ncbi:MAG: YggS family pyridoxal phosphate-dependent enzyme [Candidatus Omnitrophota bacterium]
MVKANLNRIKERIARVCSKINREVESITIVAVAKNRTAEQIKEAVEAGISDIGENRVQEALVKFDELRVISYELRLKWHMVGHLQSNKVKDAVKLFDLIHSVDSLKLAEEIDKQAKKIDKIQDVLIEINASGEAFKYGFKPQEAIEVVKDMASLKNLSIKGLMTVAPIVDNPEKTKPYFRMLREIRDRINEHQVSSIKHQVLSMGMSDDFEAAIEEGADIVRLGRAIFE